MGKSKFVNDFITGKHSLTDALSKLLVIANKLSNKKMETWIMNELYGYDLEKKVPPYRINNDMIVDVIFDGGIAPIKSSRIVEEKFVDVIRYICIDSLSAIEEKAKNGFIYDLSPKIPMLYEIDKNLQNIYEIKKTIPISFFTNIINNIKKKVLDIILKLDEKSMLIDNELNYDKKQIERANNDINIYMQDVIFEDLTVVGNSIKSEDNRTMSKEIKIGDNNKIKNSNIGNDVCITESKEKHKVLTKILIPIFVTIVGGVIVALIVYWCKLNK